MAVAEEEKQCVDCSFGKFLADDAELGWCELHRMNVRCGFCCGYHRAQDFDEWLERHPNAVIQSHSVDNENDG